MKCIAITLAGYAAFLSVGCVDRGWEPTEKELMHAKLDAWVQEFRLYHGLHQEPAPSLEAVITDVAQAVQKTLPLERRSVLSEEEKKEFLADLWGTPLSFSYETQGEAWIVTVVSAGPDRRFTTVDDLRESIRIEQSGKRLTP